MASTGIEPSAACAEKWALVKKPQGKEDGKLVRGYIFGFDSENPKKVKFIEPRTMIEMSTEEDGSVNEKTMQADWDTFVAMLPPKDSLYCAYDFMFTDKKSGYNDGDEETAPIKTKLVLISWAPDIGKPQMKMLVPSSLGGIKDVCVGHQFYIQANSLDDLTYEAVQKKLGC